MPQNPNDGWVDDNGWVDDSPMVSAPKSWMSSLTESWAPKVNIPQNIPEWQKLPGEIYNRFIEPMTSPLGAMLTGFGGTAIKPLASLFPKVMGSGLAALGGSQAIQLPSTIGNISREGLNARNVVDLTENLTGAAAVPFGVGMVRKNMVPKVSAPSSVINKVEAPISQAPTVLNPQQAMLDLDYNDIVKPTLDSPAVNISQPNTPVDIKQKLNAAIQKTRPLTKAQEILLSTERSDRISRALSQGGEGQNWAKSFMGQLAGEHTKIKMEPLKLDQADVDEIFNAIKSSKETIGFDKAKAITATTKLLTGEVLQRGEIDHLSKLFGKDTGILLSKQLPTVDKARGLVEEFVNLPRAIMASLDVSGPFRQGLGLVGEKTFWESMPVMLKAYGSRKVFDGIQESIEANPKFKMMKDSGLALTDLLGSNREERFMSNWAERIPLIRNAVSPANRAYTGYLNKLRADTFDKLTSDVKIMGAGEPEKNLVLTKEIANFINNATGRGSLGKFEQSAVGLNSVLFSPRLIASRVKMLYPGTYVKASPEVRKQYLKSMLSIGAAGNTVLGLAAMGGAEIDMDPRGSDFMKAKIGNTRLDPWGGFQQYGVLGARQLLGESKSVTSGNTYELGSRYGLPTRLDIAARFGESKLHPFASFFTTLLRGKNWAGQPISIPEELIRRYTPMITQDLYDILQDDPALAPLVLPAIGGMGVQTFGGNDQIRGY